jgi:putative transposase
MKWCGDVTYWIGNYYNPVRRRSTLGYLTPGEYELGHRQLSQLAA